jgi:hypothetical protein
MLDKLFEDLYEVFSYLLPGIPELLATLTLFWSFHPFPVTASILERPVTLWVWVCAGLAAYFIGHASAGLAWFLYGDYWESKVPTDFEGRNGRNLAKRFFNWQGWDRPPFADVVSPRLLEKARRIVGPIPGFVPQEVSPPWVLDFCGQTVSRAEGPSKTGITERRRIYAYREGFYTGTSLSILFFALALIVRLEWGPCSTSNHVFKWGPFSIPTLSRGSC